MARPLQPATADTVTATRAALEHLKAARVLLTGTGSPMALASVRSAIASTGGAVRHAERRASETLKAGQPGAAEPLEA